MSETGPDGYPHAIYEGDGILYDPASDAGIRAINKENCRFTVEAETERIAKFTRRFRERGLTPQEALIALANVDDPHGAIFAGVVMPGHDWQAYRDQGMTPYACGIVLAEGMHNFLGQIDPEAAAKLGEMTDLSVVVIDHGVAQVFPAPQI